MHHLHEVGLTTARATEVGEGFGYYRLLSLRYEVLLGFTELPHSFLFSPFSVMWTSEPFKGTGTSGLGVSSTTRSEPSCRSGAATVLHYSLKIAQQNLSQRNFLVFEKD